MRIVKTNRDHYIITDPSLPDPLTSIPWTWGHLDVQRLHAAGETSLQAYIDVLSNVPPIDPITGIVYVISTFDNPVVPIIVTARDGTTFIEVPLQDVTCPTTMLNLYSIAYSTIRSYHPSVEAALDCYAELRL